jgi:cyclopropane fatty-acyl-phospholipid synthase-like methyltransferase
MAGDASDPERWGVATHRWSFPLGIELARSGHLDGAQRALDIAGGIGSMCVALALELPDLELTLLELPETIPVSHELFARYEVEDRVRTHPANMFEDHWPREQDAVLFTNVFHSWEEERCRALARRAHDALRPGGHVVLHEVVMPSKGETPTLHAATFNMRMMWMMRGRQYRGDELRDMLTDAGFERVEIEPALAGFSRILGRKPLPAR